MGLCNGILNPPYMPTFTYIQKVWLGKNKKELGITLSISNKWHTFVFLNQTNKNITKIAKIN